jgi:hypothetical protein
MPLEAVLEHNRLDLLSLAGLTSRLLALLAGGPSTARNAREALALGRIYRRSGLNGRAHEGFVRALELASPDGPRSAPLRCTSSRSATGMRAATRTRQVAGRPSSRRLTARRSCGERPRKRWRFTTSIVSGICRRRVRSR